MCSDDITRPAWQTYPIPTPRVDIRESVLDLKVIKVRVWRLCADQWGVSITGETVYAKSREEGMQCLPQLLSNLEAAFGALRAYIATEKT